MSSSTHQIKVKANDQTAGAFASIQKRAEVAGSNIRKMLGGALVAAGGYLGVRAFAKGADELGRMSDIAMKASTSVDELSKLSNAFNILGIQGMGIEQIADSFVKMQKSTGRTGLKGFYQTINELSQIDDIAQRTSLAMEVFGRSGANFMPLTNAANSATNSLKGISTNAVNAAVNATNSLKGISTTSKDVANSANSATNSLKGISTTSKDVANAGVNALQQLTEMMPSISQSAADAGDKLSDAKNIGVEGFKNLWLEAVGAISKNIDDSFEGGIRQASLNGVAYMNYFIKSTWADLTTWFAKLGLKFQGFDNNLLNVATSFAGALVGSIKAVVDELKNLTQKATDSFGQSIGQKMYEWLNESLGKDNANKFKHFLDKAGISDFVFGRNIENWRPPKPKEIRYDDTVSNIMNGIKDAFKKNVTDKVDWLAVDALESQNTAYKKELEDRLTKQLNQAKQIEDLYGSSASSAPLPDNDGNKTSNSNNNSSRKLANQSVNNNLIMAGSNAALKLSIIGPQKTQLDELKKQTTALDKIQQATQKTAKNTSNNAVATGNTKATDL